MNFKAILYSTDMVQAMQEGRKTMTRRTQGLEEINKQPDAYSVATVNIGEYVFESEAGGQKSEVTIKAKYQKGDILWVRESFAVEGLLKNVFFYKADIGLPKIEKWKPSIHMPKVAARYFQKVTNVRVERLLQISEEDAVAEGCSKYGPFGEYRGSRHPNGGQMKYRAYSTAQRAFQCIWETINGKESWELNPWVFVYEFEVLDIAQSAIAKANLLK